MKTIKRKSLLYKSGVEYADYGLNHIEGCAHGCMYPCYAMMMKKRCGQIKTYQEWIQPKIVSNALELLDKELSRQKHKINSVFLCFSTDSFMYQIKEVENLTLKILERLNRDNVKSVLISKGVYPNDLTDKLTYNPDNEYGSTIVSLSEDFRKRFEPFAAPIKLRVKSLRRLHNAGLKTWVSIEPYPTPNIIQQNIKEILAEVSFVDKIVFGKWNYSKQTSDFRFYKTFYNSMAYEVIKFCFQNGMDVHIKEGTLNLDLIPDNRHCEKDLLSQYVAWVFTQPASLSAQTQL